MINKIKQGKDIKALDLIQRIILRITEMRKRK